MMNHNTPQGEVELPEFFDLSHGSNNTYLVEARHRMIPTCIHCRQFRPVLLDGNEYYRYFIQGLGNSVAEAFPKLDSTQHELLMTGIHPACWEAIFADDEEVNDD